MTVQYKYNKTWRQRHPERRKEGKDRYYTKHREDPANQRNRRQRWTSADIDAIMAPDRPPDTTLAKRLGRSLQAIQIKRAKLNQRSA